jgi:hypothetical protein
MMFNVMKKNPLLFAGECTFCLRLSHHNKKTHQKHEDWIERICSLVRLKVIKD